VEEEADVLEPFLDGEVAGLLAHPNTVRVRGHTRKPHPSRPVLDEEQDVQRPQPHGLDREEIASHDAVRLGAQELGPRRSATARRRTETRAPHYRPDRRRAHPNTKLAQLTLDPHTTPPRILPGEPQNKVAHRRIKRRPTR
jgi:hypothetical protein